MLNNLQTPNLISPGYSPMFYLNSSDYSDETGFKYVYSLYNKDGLVVTKKVFPFPNELGRIDASTIIKNYLGSHLLYSTTGITSTNNSIIQYDMYIGYTGSTHTMTPSTTGIKFAFNGVDDNFNFTNYLLTNSSSKFLTNSPRTIDVYLTDYYTLSILNGVFDINNSSLCKYVNIKTFYITGGTSTYQITNPHFDYLPPEGELSNIPNSYKTIGVGPMNLPSYINSNVKYYEVWITNNLGIQTSEKFRFNINYGVTKYGKHQICFLNRLGNFSYFTFIGKTTHTTKQSKDTYLRNRYYLSNNTWTTDISSAGKSVYNNEITDEYIFVSDYINQETYDFMNELFTSPEVYYLSSSGAIPVIILDTEFINRKVINDKMINFTLKVGTANNKIINV